MKRYPVIGAMMLGVDALRLAWASRAIGWSFVSIDAASRG